MDGIRELFVGTINNRANDGRTLCPPTIEEFDTVLNLHRDFFKSQDAVYAHLWLIKPTREEKMETRIRVLTKKRLWLEMGLSKTPKDHLVFYHAADEQDIFDGLDKKIEDPLERRHRDQVKIDKIISRMKGGFPYRMQMQ